MNFARFFLYKYALIISSLFGTGLAFLCFFGIKVLLGNTYYNSISNLINVVTIISIVDFGIPNYIYIKSLSEKNNYFDDYRLFYLLYSIIVSIFFCIIYVSNGDLILHLLCCFLFTFSNFYGSILRVKFDIHKELINSSVFRLFLPLTFYLPLVLFSLIFQNQLTSILIGSIFRLTFLVWISKDYTIPKELNLKSTADLIKQSFAFNVSNILGNSITSGFFVRSSLIKLNPETSIIFLYDVFNKILVFPSLVTVIRNKGIDILFKNIRILLMLFVNLTLLVFGYNQFLFAISFYLTFFGYQLYNDSIIKSFDLKNKFLNRFYWQLIPIFLSVYFFGNYELFYVYLIFIWSIIDYLNLLFIIRINKIILTKYFNEFLYIIITILVSLFIQYLWKNMII
jgi:hypothetical protein